MSTFLQCSTCGRHWLTATDGQAGAQAECPFCGKIIPVLGPAKGVEILASSRGRVTGTSATAGKGRYEPPGGRFWLLLGDSPSGPFDRTQLHAKLMAGVITRQTPACPVGANSWLPLGQLPEFGPAEAAPAEAVQTSLSTGEPLDALPAVLPAPREQRQASVSTPAWAEDSKSAPKVTRAWSPTAIAWLGLLFSPVWAGIMAAINGRRLGLSFPLWRPVYIGVGSLLLDIGIGAVYDAYWVDVLLYLGALGLLWHLDLRGQSRAYQAQLEAGQARHTGGWLLPVLAGSPAALIVFLAFVVVPLLPLEPRQVCEKLNAAKTEKEMKKYTTINLWPALTVLAQQADASDSDAFELTEEGPAPAEVGGYCVGFRGIVKEGGEYHQIEGVFHLVNWQGEWKVEDMYITSADRQPLERWVSLARDYQQMASSAPSKPQVTTAAARPPSSTQPKQNPSAQNPLNTPGGRGAASAMVRGLWFWLAHGEGKSIGKGMGVVLLAIVAGLCRFGKWLWTFITSGAHKEQKTV